MGLDAKYVRALAGSNLWVQDSSIQMSYEKVDLILKYILDLPSVLDSIDSSWSNTEFQTFDISKIQIYDFYDNSNIVPILL